MHEMILLVFHSHRADSVIGTLIYERCNERNHSFYFCLAPYHYTFHQFMSHCDQMTNKVNAGFHHGVMGLKQFDQIWNLLNLQKLNSKEPQILYGLNF